ncbi:MAG: MerR family transcriptional regulator [Paracoccaceae bacterium]
MAQRPEGGRAETGKSAEAFRTISEVSTELGVPQHVLRFWETRFAQLKPMKRNGGRRLYRPDHLALLRGIKALLYEDGLTIKGVQKVLREKGVRAVMARGKSDAALSLAEPVPEDVPERLAEIRRRLEQASALADPAGPEPDEPQPRPDREQIRASIARLERILDQLEK